MGGAGHSCGYWRACRRRRFEHLAVMVDTALDFSFDARKGGDAARGGDRVSRPPRNSHMWTTRFSRLHERQRG